MTTAGYSGTPLIKKLGLNPGHRIWLFNSPAGYSSLLGSDPSGQICSPRETPDWAHLFAVSQKAFEKGMQPLNRARKKNPRLIVWVSWYKKSSGISTDLTENIIRDYALANGWVDVKVCAVNEEWSGLKLVVPLSMR